MYDLFMLTISVTMLGSFLYMISIPIFDFFKKKWFSDNINIDEIIKLQTKQHV